MPSIPFALECSFPENRLLPLKDVENGCLCSTTALNNSGIAYHLKIYPNGHKENFRGNTLIFLYLTLGKVKLVEADFILSIDSSNYSKKCHFVYKDHCGPGYPICKTKQFFDPEKKYIVDGKLTFTIKGTFKFESEGATIPVEEQKWIGGKLGDDLWQKDGTKDFGVVVDGQEIKVHKFILGNRSDVFSSMLNSNMKEAIESKVIITDFSFDVVEAAFKLIYNCNFTTSFSIDELIGLLQFFDKYTLGTFKEEVESFLINHISSSTVVRLTNGSIFTNSSTLKERCIEFLLICSKQQTAVSDIESLDKDTAFTIFQRSFTQMLKMKE